MLKKARAGRAINEEDIPPPVYTAAAHSTPAPAPAPAPAAEEQADTPAPAEDGKGQRAVNVSMVAVAHRVWLRLYRTKCIHKFYCVSLIWMIFGKLQDFINLHLIALFITCRSVFIQSR